MVLEETDYHGIVSLTPEIEITDLKTKCWKKLAEEFEHLIAQSVQPLTGFLKMILHGFMIDNVVNVIEGVKNNVDVEVLLKRADPLGDFPELKNIRMVDGDDYGQLYETVLIDLPIGVYFRKLLAQEDASSADRIAEAMRDYRPEKIKNLLKKIWITELYNYVNTHLNECS